jgi:two-component sensor histidine kinase
MMPEGAHFVLPRSLEAAGRGRRLIGAALGFLSRPLLDSILLVQTELVTNSVRHGGVGSERGVEVKVRVGEQTVTLEVCDSGPGLDPEIIPEPRDEGGWGLVVVERLSTRWGVSTNDHTCVWAEFDLGATHSSST